jgi:hypothetical protein
MDLARIRAVRRSLWEDLASMGRVLTASHTVDGPRRDPLAALERLERYDRRARSRRKKAIRRFTEAVRSAQQPEGA